MSRTNKNKPVWVTAEWYEPFHGCGWYKVRKYVETDVPLSWDKTRFEKKFVGYTWEYRGDCDLPAEPIRSNKSLAWRNRKSGQLCTWDMIWPRDRYYGTRGVRKTAYCREGFHKPQRRAVRDASRKAVQGDWEVEFPDGRTRSSVRWDMW